MGLLSKRNRILRFLFVAILFFNFSQSFSQTPGLIIEPSSGMVLDPNKDGYITLDGQGFSLDGDDTDEFEGIGWWNIPILGEGEKIGDVRSGQKEGYTDFSSDSKGYAAYLRVAENNIIFRIRLADYAPNSIGYTILLDTDGNIGEEDNTFVYDGNPGFELAVVLKSKEGVYIVDFDATEDDGECDEVKYSYTIEEHHQKAIAGIENGGDPDAFYDFYVPLEDIYSAGGLSELTKLRWTVTSNTSNSCTFSGSVSDIAGLDDQNFPCAYCALEEIVRNQDPVSIAQIRTGDLLTPCPSITNEVYAGNSIRVSGASIPGATVRIYVNKILETTGTADLISGIYEIELPVLTVGDFLAVTAEDTGKGLSESSPDCNSRIIEDGCDSNTRPTLIITDPPGNSAKLNGFSDIRSESIDGIEIQVRVKGVINLESGEIVDFNPTDGSWEYALSDEDGSDNFEPREYEARIRSVLNCWSEWVTFCGESNAARGATPTVRTPTDPVTGGSIVTFSGLVDIINVKEVTGAVIFISQGGEILASTEVDGDSNESDVFWTIREVLISSCGDIEIFSLPRFSDGISGCSTPPEEKVIIPVSPESSDSPEILGTYCSPITGIYGLSTESEGTIINVMVDGNTIGGTTVNEYGNWSLNGLDILSGSITASAQNVRNCEALSLVSNAVVISSLPVAPVIIWPAAINDGATEITVEGGSGTLVLYIDSTPVADASGNPIMSETGTFTGLSIDGVPASNIYAGGLLSVVQKDGACLSPESNTKEVACTIPDGSLSVNPTSTTISSGSTVDVTISGSEPFTFYQLYDSNLGSSSGMPRIGNGNDLVLTSLPITTNTTLEITATRIFAGECSTNLINATEVIVRAAMPTISFNTTNSFGDESVNQTALQVDLSTAYGLDVTVDYEVTGTATDGGVDYTLANGTLTISAGSINGNISISEIVNDLLDEADETVIVTLFNPINGTLGTNIVHTYMIVNDDYSPILTVGDVSIPEGTAAVIMASSTDANAGDTKVFSLSGIDALLFDIDPSTGELTFKSRPDFENPEDDNLDNIYVIDVIVTDGGGNTDMQSILITVLGINDNQPVLVVRDETVNEGSTFVETVSVADLDVPDSHTYSLEGSDAILFDIDQSTGDLFFVVAPDFENPTDIGLNNIYNFEVVVVDEVGNSDRKFVEVTVEEINDNYPVLNVKSNVSIAEGSANVMIALASDLDVGDTKTFSISGTDASFFHIDSINGVLTFNNPPDFESALDDGTDNTYDLIIIVVDGAGNSDSQAIKVTITPVNDNDPVILAQDAMVEEGMVYVQTVSATDGDEGDTHTFGISGSDVDFFNIDPRTGKLTFKSGPKFDDPQDSNGDNTYEITVTVSDEAGNTDRQSIQITVNGVPNGNPVAVEDEFMIDEGDLINGLSLLSNDSDPDNDSLIINTVPVVNVSHGSLLIQPDGTFKYIPDMDFFGTDSFSYEVCDQLGACGIASVTIIINEVNTDFDNDGIPNDIEGNIDTDGDGIPDNEDTDSDNDGIADEIEGNTDTDNDGIPDYKDEDSDDDGISDYEEGDIDTDGDGIPNFQDQDADNDGIPDYEELGSDRFADCDGDGIPNYLDKTRCGIVASKGYSPNGDGENDFWLVEGIKSYPNNSVKVFNRWGNLIFDRKGYDNEEVVWIGQSEGALVLGQSEIPDGTYFYVIDLGNGDNPLSGYIILKR